MKYSPFGSTLAGIKHASYRKPQNVLLNPYAIYKKPSSSMTCPFFGDRSKGCRCVETLPTLSRELCNTYLSQLDRHFKDKHRILTFRNFSRANKRNSKLALMGGVEWQDVAHFVQKHKLNTVDIKLIDDGVQS